jgi:hypothetical protein
MGKITRDELDSSLQTEVDKIGILSNDTDTLKTENKALKKEIANLNLQLEASQRVVNGKTFATDFLNTFGMTIDYTKTTVQGTTSSGATTVTVDDATGFQVGQEVTIYDDVNIERVTISDIQGNDITFSTQLVNSYKDEANIARTMAVEDTINQCLKFGGWGTSTSHDVQDATVVASAYDTSGNGGRKIANTESGVKVFAVKNGTSEIRLYKKVGNNAPEPLANFSVTTLTDVAIWRTKGEIIGIIYSHSGSTVSFRTVNATDGTLSSVIDVDTGQSAVGNVTFIANDTFTETHMAVATKNSTYPNSFNIRYVKGTINADGSVTWGSVEQVSGTNTSGLDYLNPSIVVRSNNLPLIVVEYGGSSNTAKAIRCFAYDGSSWGTHPNNGITIYLGSSYTQSSPSAIFVPQSVNGLTNGRIWVAWHGTDSTDTTYNNIRFAYSDDGGVTWSSMKKLTTGNTVHRRFASGTVDKNGKYYVEYEDNGTIKRLESTDGGITWGSPITVGTGANVSTLYDNTFNLDFSNPLSIRMSGSSVLFKGTWTIGTTTPILENDVRFTVADTDEIALWVQRDELAGFTVDAEVNGNAMTKTSVTGEDQFAYALGSVQPIEVRLNMTRASTEDDVKITKILGGVA